MEETNNQILNQVDKNRSELDQLRDNLRFSSP